MSRPYVSGVMVCYGYGATLARHTTEAKLNPFSEEKEEEIKLVMAANDVRRICVCCQTAEISLKRPLSDKLCTECWKQQPIQTCRDCACSFRARRSQPVCIECFDASFAKYVKGQQCSGCGCTFTAKGYRRECADCIAKRLKARQRAAMTAKRGM